MPTGLPRAVARALVVASLPVLVVAAGPAASADPRSGRPAVLNVGAAQRALDALGERMSATVEEYDAARLRLSHMERAAGRASARATTARRLFDARRRQLSAYAVATYQSGVAPSFAVAVDGDPSEYLDRLSLLEEVTHRQAGIVRAVAAARVRYEQAQGDARNARERAEVVVARLGATRAAIDRQIAAQQAVLDGLTAEQNRLAQIAADQPSGRNQRAVDRVRRIRDDGGDTSQTPPPVSGRAAAAVGAAYSALGRPYSYGASGPDAFDCSGLTSWAWRHAGVSLPHSSSAQYGAGPHVSRSDLRPGDLVFFYSPIHHVGIYVGGGRMIDAPHSGTVVSVRSLLWSEYVGAIRPG